MSDLRPEALTWTALLARWVEFAQAALAIPDEDDGDRWRASIPAIINLQAVTMALKELDTVDPREWPYALDKAEILIDRNEDDLRMAWRDTDMPANLIELRDDARAAMAAAKTLDA